MVSASIYQVTYKKPIKTLLYQYIMAILSLPLYFFRLILSDLRIGIKNKLKIVWRIEKSIYLCSPQTRKRGDCS